MSWILKWISLNLGDRETSSSVSLALPFDVIDLFCYFYVSTWIKKNAVTCRQFTYIAAWPHYRYADDTSMSVESAFVNFF